MINKYINTYIVIRKSINDILNYINNLNIIDRYYIIDYNIYLIYKSLIDKLIKTNNYIFIDRGELNKNFLFIFKILNNLISLSYGKNLTIISIGGGVTGDISGFIASIYLRGIKLIHIPTTIVSQIDSSIGGKNGVNTINGKNMIGTINQPIYILIAIEFILTLPSYNYLMGFSESLKISIINNIRLFKYLPSIYIYRNINLLYYIVKLSIKSKLSIINKDLYDNNLRLKLNLGHTLAHSIESTTKYIISHDLSVLIGLYLINIFSYKYYKLPYKSFVIINKNIYKLLPSIPSIINILSIDNLSTIISDKKNIGNIVRLIIIKNIGKVIVRPLSLSYIFKFIKSLNYIYLR